MSQQRIVKLKEPKETDKDQLQCDIPTEIVKPDQSNETEESMLWKTISNLRWMILFKFRYLMKERNHFHGWSYTLDKFCELTRMIFNWIFYKKKIYFLARPTKAVLDFKRWGTFESGLT